MRWLIVLAALAVSGVATAERPAPAAPGTLPLERVFASPDLSGSQPQGLKLSPDGRLVTYLRNREDEKNRYDLWALDTTTGTERLLVDSKKLSSGADLSEAEKMRRERDRSLTGKTGILGYDWAPDGQSLLVPVDGKLFLAKLDGSVTPLPAADGALDPALSPGGGYVSFLRDQNLYVEPVADGAARKITPDGQGTVHWGEAEFVAQEEMHRFAGYWWSPDDRLIAVERYDEAPVGIVTRAAIGADATRTYSQRYPAAGTANVAVALYVMRPDGTGSVKVDLGSDPDIYLARVDWSPDGRLFVQRQSRDQRTLDLLAVDLKSGATRAVFTEKSLEKSWLNLSDSYRFLKDGSLIWRSERDGYGHLYRFKDGAWIQLTKGPWVVTKLVGVDEAAGRLFFLGNKDDVLEQQLYAIDIARPAEITRLTETGWWNDASMDRSARRLIITRSNPTQPPQIYLADPAARRVAWINENRIAPGHPYYPYAKAQRAVKFGTLKAADGTTLYWQMVTPPLVAGKRYPVFFQHYGGPGTGQQVMRGWMSPLVQAIVARGYIFFQIDNRGSFNRGKAFEDQIYRAMGTVEVEDQLAGAKWLKMLPFVDPDRIGIYGWSYGGYMTLKMLEANPGVYAAGVSGAPVTKWELYDTHYTERYLGTPAGDPGVYAAADAIGRADAIGDPLLLIHGMADDNVVFENSTTLVARLQAGNRPFEMMFYPGKTHAAARDLHVWLTIMRFFDREVRDRKR